MKKAITIILAGLLVVAFAASAFAWEFSMKGSHEYRFRYIARTGPNDLFGLQTYNSEGTGNVMVGPVGFAGPSHYANTGATASANNSPIRITRRGFSNFGSDAMYADQRLVLRPEIRVNEAIRISGVYNVGGMRNFTNHDAGGYGVPAYEPYAMERSGASILSTTMLGSWEDLRAVLQLPWGVVSYGQKNFPFGPGATCHGALTKSDSLLLAAPYGPLTIMWAVHLARNGVNAGTANWGTNADRNDKNQYFGAHVITYNAANVSMGGFYYPQWVRRSRQLDTLALATSNPRSATLAGRIAGVPAADIVAEPYLVYAQYNNGRFFANAEYFWMNVNTRIVNGMLPITAVNPATGTQVVYTPTGADVAPQNTERYGAFAEIGSVVGPAKLSLMYAQGSGPVLNNGNRTKTYTNHGIHAEALAPYQFLMVDTYFGGNQETTLGSLTAPALRGALSDATAYAARLDYAVACNLNVWGSYFWAHRLEKYGTYMGQYDSTGGNSTAANMALFRTNAGVTGWTIADPNSAQFGTTVAYVPDGYLGYEVGGGVDWKLLENLTWRNRYSYWQPGPWFKYAYQAVIDGQDNRVLASRDAIQAYEASLVIDF